MCRELTRLWHHGGAGFLPSDGSDVFFRSDESDAGRSGGAGRPGVHERVLSVRAGPAVVSGAGRIHGHGHVPAHGSGLIQLPALEDGERARKEKRIKEEDKVRERNVRCVEI